MEMQTILAGSLMPGTWEIFPGRPFFLRPSVWSAFRNTIRALLRWTDGH